MMTSVKAKAVFPCPVERVWDIVTSLENTAWRSDLSRVEITDENRFVEYTKSGYPTVFTVTAREECRRWEFDLENGNMSGHWKGLFSQNGGLAELELTEYITVKKPVMKLLIRPFLKRQQRAYIKDLRRALALF